MPICCVPGCRNKSKNPSKKAEGITHHRLPMNKPDLLAQWLQNIQRPNWKPSGSYYVCSDHFAMDSFECANVIRLRAGAVPTIFNQNAEHSYANKNTASFHSEQTQNGDDQTPENRLVEPFCIRLVASGSPSMSGSSNLCHLRALDSAASTGQEQLPGAGIDATMEPTTTQVYTKELTKSLLEFQQEGYLCDTLLIADDGQLKAHSAVLAAASPVFKAALNAGDKPKEHTIVLPGVKLYVVNIAVHFAYTGELVVPKQYVTSPDLVSMLVVALSQLGLKLATFIVGCGSNQFVEHDNTIELESGNHSSSMVSRPLDEALLSTNYNSKDVKKQKVVKLHAKKPKSVRHAVVKTDTKARKQSDAVVGYDSSNLSTYALDNDKSGEPNSAVEASSAIVNRHCDDECSYNAVADIAENVSASGDIAEVNIDDRLHNGDKTLKEVSSMCEISPKETSRNGVASKVHSSKKRSLSNKHTSDNSSSQSMCDICGKLVNARCMFRHRMTHNAATSRLQCPDCGRKCANSCSLRRHQKLHTDDRPFVCEHCGKRFIQKRLLIDHRWSQHWELIETERKHAPLHCQTCNEGFFSLHRLRKHSCTGDAVRPPAKHPVRYPAPRRCFDCHQLFPSATALIAHVRTKHGSLRPFGCTTCGARFRSSLSLFLHNATHSTAENRYSCSHCEHSFDNLSQLSLHLRVRHGRDHNDEPLYRCSLCSRSVTNRQELKKHEMTHTGARPFQCTVCGMLLRQSAHLRRHMLVHTGERRYRCRLCEKAYKARLDLRIHCRRVHQLELPKYQQCWPEINTITDCDGDGTFDNYDTADAAETGNVENEVQLSCGDA